MTPFFCMQYDSKGGKTDSEATGYKITATVYMTALGVLWVGDQSV